NLKGVIAGSPFLGPLLETIDSSEFLFSVGMLNTTSKVLFHQAFENLTKETNRTIQLFTFFKTVFQDYTKKNPTLFQRLTGYNFDASVLHTRIPQEFVEYKKYVNNSDFKTRIHVGSDAVFRKQMPGVVISMGMVDFFTNITLMVQSVFDNYRVLIYGGQLDTIFPAINMDRFYNSLEWKGSEDFRKERVTWYDEDDPDYLNGYVKKGGNVTYVLFVGAGHDPGFDAPKLTHKMIGQFLKQQELVV
ncbi:serine carboxypeptidase, putative, partial [Ixodes scapularis]